MVLVASTLEAMVTPVTAQGATTQSVYLPAAGGTWYDFWTGKATAGGQRVDAAAPVETLRCLAKLGVEVEVDPIADILVAPWLAEGGEVLTVFKSADLAGWRAAYEALAPIETEVAAW